MAFTNAWDETVPAGTRDANLGDDDIRQFKLDIRERIAVDHVMTDTDAATTGYHKVVDLTVQSTPTAVADVGQLYTKDVNSKAELHFQDEDSNEVQLTSAGAMLVPAGAIVLWDGAGCPTGWTLLTSYDNKFLVGSGTAGTTGGADSIDLSHTHQMAHTHLVSGNTGAASTDVGAGDSGVSAPQQAHTHSVSITSGAASNDTTDSKLSATQDNRPAFKTIKLCKKD